MRLWPPCKLAISLEMRLLSFPDRFFESGLAASGGDFLSFGVVASDVVEALSSCVAALSELVSSATVLVSDETSGETLTGAFSLEST